ncbi:DNA-directed RNA polymerase specialized sigma24 family protein [Kitasatospora sp. MAP12-15]|uniref:BACON domain-containing protein n=1 Tax=unclassified Kitasatospora TaxID=2633591 RepID=UPI0024767E1E|nr:sigma-70 family RNA polymerase sigma factor [Kitasatospora sp. MAP12-44]MDH6111221.1 DNA-directed RNA polymerase specialized sigma24 family protein [Kitasatospora sp. MAP12-44]
MKPPTHNPLEQQVADQVAATVLPAYGRLADGLFTYCLSVLCEHDAALAALRETRELALRNGSRLAAPGLLRAWLYSLARYACMRRLAERADGAVPVRPTPGEAGRRKDELASLAWPEAAGTTAEQREALELSVRHRLTPLEIAAVLGLGIEATQALLADGGAEVDRTRSALAVLGVGNCPELARLGGPGADHWRAWVLSPALRRELVRHVLECPTCRGTAERVAGEPAAGPAGRSGLGLVRAPGEDGPAAPEAQPVHFDQRGFPRHRQPGYLERHRAGGDLHGRTVLVRQRALTTGVLAAVLSAPLVALWVAHRDGGGTDTAAVSAVRVDGGAGDRDGTPLVAAPLPDLGGPPTAAPVAGGQPGGNLAPAVLRPATAETLLPAVQGVAIPVPAGDAVPLGSPQLTAQPAPPLPPASPAGGWLTVEASPYGARTVLTLTNTGATTIDWQAVTTCDWLRLSRDSGSLAPGQRITVTVTVDDTRAPQDHWTAQIALPPSEAVVTLEGGSEQRGGTPSPSSSPSSGPAPSASANPSGSASSTPSVAPTSGSSASSAPSSSASPSAAPTSGPSSSPPPAPSSSPSTGPTAPSNAPSATPTTPVSSAAPAR